MLETNYQTVKSLEAQADAVTIGPTDTDRKGPSHESGDVDNPWETQTPGHDALSPGDDGGLVKGLVEEICSMEQFAEKRSIRLDQDDILALLAVFNTRGLHFC